MYRGGGEVCGIRITECVEVRMQKLERGECVDGAVKRFVTLPDFLPGVHQRAAAALPNKHLRCELSKILVRESEIRRSRKMNAAWPGLDESEARMQRLFSSIHADVYEVRAIGVTRPRRKYQSDAGAAAALARENALRLVPASEGVHVPRRHAVA